MKQRLFIALRIPSEILAGLDKTRREIADYNLPGKWEPIRKLHITAKFLGDTEEERIFPVIEELGRVLAGYNKISAALSSFDFFLPRILYAGIKTEESLQLMVRDIEDSMVSLGFFKENAEFVAHITLMRMRRQPEASFISSFRNYKLPDESFYMNTVSLMKSTLSPAGSVFTEIENFNLK